MVRQGTARTGLAVVAGLLLLAAPLFLAPVHAQQAPAASPIPSPAAVPAPAAPATPAPTPSPSPMATPAPSASPANPAGESGSMGETVELVAHPAATVDGKADRDEVFGAITGSIDQIHKEIAKAGLKAAGRPIAIFLEADDVGFKYRAAIPLEIGSRRQDRAFRHGQAGADAGRQGDALRTSRRLRRHRRDL